MVNVKTCLVCGKEFTPTGRVQYCCSKECSAIQKATKERNKRKERGPVVKVGKCMICGKEFTKSGHYQKTCSPECSSEKNRRNARARHEKTTVTLTCPICGKQFDRKTGNQKFCCIKCKRKHDRKKNHVNVAEKPAQKLCVVCGKPIVSIHVNQVVCSDECRRIHNKELKKASARRHAEHRFIKCYGCGKVFQVVGAPHRYCNECREKGRGRSSSARSSLGLTADEMLFVAYVQDRMPYEQAYEAAKSWTPQQRKYALARWKQIHSM